MSAKKSFRGVLEPIRSNLGWLTIRVPFDPVTEWPRRKRLRVKGTINGFPFRTSLFGTSDGGHLLLVNKKMQRGADVRVGGVASVVLEPDLEERVATVPPELAAVLKQDRALKAWFERLSYSIRKYIGNSVSEPKSAEARARRAAQIAERMLLAMEGERVLPPILQIAFQREPRARAGWDAMTPIQRRGHLLGIFYYQSPEAREKRAAKAVEEALNLARSRASEDES